MLCSKSVATPPAPWNRHGRSSSRVLSNRRHEHFTNSRRASRSYDLCSASFRPHRHFSISVLHPNFSRICSVDSSNVCERLSLMSSKADVRIITQHNSSAVLPTAITTSVISLQTAPPTINRHLQKSQNSLCPCFQISHPHNMSTRHSNLQPCPRRAGEAPLHTPRQARSKT